MLYIHIGFHKTGTTTIQRFLTDNAEILARRDVIYPRTGRHNTAHFNLSWESKEKAGFALDRGSWSDVADEIRQAPDKNFVISSEGLHALRMHKIRNIATTCDGIDTTIICYIRDLANLIQSSYGQRAKSGIYTSDFDDYFSELPFDDPGSNPVIDISRQLSRWAEVFGWSNMRIRSIDPADLIGGSLLTDFQSAIGLDPAETVEDWITAPDLSVNTGLGWKTLELTRALHALSGGRVRMRDEAQGERSRLEARRVSERIRRACEAAARDLGLSEERGQYLTPAQWNVARDAYNRELRELNAHTEHQIPEPDRSPPPERPFLPSVDVIDERERLAFNERVLHRLIPQMADERGRRRRHLDGRAAS